MTNKNKTFKIITTTTLGIAVFLSAPGPVLAAALSAAELVELTNQERRANNLQPLAPNQKLAQAAYEKAQNLLQNGYFAHTSPTGRKFHEWITAAGYNYTYAGENLAIDFEASREVIQAWRESPRHKENILNSNYSEIGIAAVRGNFGSRATTVVVQMFGSPTTPSAAGAILEKIENQRSFTKEDLASFAERVAFLPSLAGHDYFDVILKASESAILGVAVPDARAAAANTPIVHGQTFRTLVKSGARNLSGATAFALTENTNKELVSLPITLPSFNEIAERLNPSQGLAKNSSLDIVDANLLAGLSLFLLLIAFRPEINKSLQQT